MNGRATGGYAEAVASDRDVSGERLLDAAPRHFILGLDAGNRIACDCQGEGLALRGRPAPAAVIERRDDGRPERRSGE